MLTLHKRRRIAGTVTYTTANPPHAQSWRAANDEQEDDALRAARGIINALVIGAALWALLAVGVWALSFLWA
jgi:hypothetical protein